MRLGYTILYVSDVRATIDFYERAFGVNRRMVKDEDYAELDTGATVLAFAANEFARQITPVPFDAADLSKPAPPIVISGEQNRLRTPGSSVRRPLRLK